MNGLSRNLWIDEILGRLNLTSETSDHVITKDNRTRTIDNKYVAPVEAEWVPSSNNLPE